MLMIKERPDLFFAYVGTDQNGPDPEFETFEVQRQALIEKKDKKGVLLLEKMGKDPRYWNREDFDKLNQHLVHSIEQVPNMIMDLMLPSMISSPEHSIKEIFDIFKGMNYSLNHLYAELMTFDFEEKIVFYFDIPIFIFHVDNDIFILINITVSYIYHIK